MVWSSFTFISFSSQFIQFLKKRSSYHPLSGTLSSLSTRRKKNLTVFCFNLLIAMQNLRRCCVSDQNDDPPRAAGRLLIETVTHLRKRKRLWPSVRNTLICIAPWQNRPFRSWKSFSASLKHLSLLLALAERLFTLSLNAWLMRSLAFSSPRFKRWKEKRKRGGIVPITHISVTQGAAANKVVSFLTNGVKLLFL